MISEEVILIRKAKANKQCKSFAIIWANKIFEKTKNNFKANRPQSAKCFNNVWGCFILHQCANIKKPESLGYN